MAIGPDESGLVIPALELIPLVEEFRRRFDPSARAGVPPHVTVVGPFLDPELLTDRVFQQLDRLVAPTRPFAYSLAAVREFAGGVLYLAPDPPEPFVALTQLVSRRFRIKPYGGAYKDVVPHLTVSQTATEAERSEIATVLAKSIPVWARATEVWVMTGHNDRTWTTVRSIAFSG